MLTVVSPKDNAETLRKIYKEESKGGSRKGSLDDKNLEKTISDQPNQQDESQTIYFKQTIESYRDSKHSLKLDEQEVRYSMTIKNQKDGRESKLTLKPDAASERQSNKQSFKPHGSSKDEKEQEVEESPYRGHTRVVDLDQIKDDAESDVVSKKSAAISVMRSEDLESKKSVAISVMRSDDLESKKSVAISVMKSEDLRSKKSIAIS
jgi:hypothetical protein